MGIGILAIRLETPRMPSMSMNALKIVSLQLPFCLFVSLSCELKAKFSKFQTTKPRRLLPCATTMLEGSSKQVKATFTSCHPSVPPTSKYIRLNRFELNVADGGHFQIHFF